MQFDSAVSTGYPSAQAFSFELALVAFAFKAHLTIVSLLPLRLLCL